MYGQVWADAGTYSGPDEDPFFDEDDEFVFMARHLGSKRPPGFLSPPGTLSVSLTTDIIEISSFSFQKSVKKLNLFC